MYADLYTIAPNREMEFSAMKLTREHTWRGAKQ